ncbi:G-type lectin S-receptor-like serine/threonine-protein kinase At2g19130 [Impatiens glandulifera]|uniref:G-type lectin S-receptor-like serine/threonine-protein kinase At2g19130 n=1 Tax=Impatiens glandulifera TaxID=253017 RepID=UPI001FB0FC8B|nr:G-type lectin S-receptor-like serine/threonine-protein kinase At2g19130 [Impatiens glandulifera]
MMDGIRRKNHSFFFFFLLCFSSINRLSHGGNTISANETLSGDQTIISSSGIFVLGFFNPGNSTKNYIGMWYNNITPQTVVWVANRETPISDRYSSSLRILNGSLVLLNESQSPIWSTTHDTPNFSPPLEAILGDDGNLVLKDRSNSTVWQSFDHPVHTWLPGGKISYNKRTNTHQILTSWKNSEDPSPGLYSLELDANNSQYLIKWNRSEQYWTSGPWNGEIFSLVPEMRNTFLYNFTYVSNENESYFTYSMYNPNVVSRFYMDVTGQVKQVSLVSGVGWNLFWSQPRQQCEVYAYCGTFGACNQITLPFCNCLKGFNPKSPNDWNLEDFSDGCVRNIELQQCGNTNGKKDGFRMLPGMGLPEKSVSWSVGSEKECEASCLNNCSCTAYAYDNGCLIWVEGLLNLQQLSQNDGNGRSIYIRLAAGELPSGKRMTGKLIGAVVGSVFVAVLCLVLFVIWWVRKRSVGKSKMEGSLIAFVYRDLQNATKNFSEKLGGGGFGSVFKGMLPDSTLIAVKRLDSISQGEKQFRMEVSTIGTVQHVNLVRLRGFCSQGDKKLLVYDYMPNGSLDSILFHKTLDWKKRQQIAIGTARGLAYLHEECRDCIVHCDIKPENILLDSEFFPKVADFGLAKLIGRDFSRVLTTMRGTRGYLAPEWISGLAITAKADVYSYGMMLFELISGRRNSEGSEDGKVKFFPTWAANLAIEGGDILNILDVRLNRETVDPEEVRRICRVACWCIQDEESDRPTMGQVVQILEGVIDVNQPPIPRSLQVIVDSGEDIVFFTESSESSSSNKSSQVRSNTSSNHSQLKGTATLLMNSGA